MTSPTAATVADNIRAEMARRRLRQGDVADALGISRTATHRRLSGELPFDVDQLRTLAGLFDVAPSTLLGESEAMSA